MNRYQEEVARLEGLWGGSFGDAYTARNQNAGDGRQPFWDQVLETCPATRTLEVGCNRGANLRWIAARRSPNTIYGIDLNQTALQEVHQNVPGVNAMWGQARALPFRDRWFDLTFTVGVLIHQPPEVLPIVMSELVRCSSRHVLCAEYYAPELTELEYHGETGALFKQDFGGMYARLFPELTLLRRGDLTRDEGWDNVTYWLFERTER